LRLIERNSKDPTPRTTANQANEIANTKVIAKEEKAEKHF